MIVINARFLVQHMTGVQRYAFELCKRLPNKIDGLDVVFVTPKQKLKSRLAPGVKIFSFGKFGGQMWEQIDLPIFLKSKGNPLLINLVGIGPVFYSKKIIALHDLAFKHHPEWFSLTFQFAYNLLIPNSIKRSLHIITVSDYVKIDIINTYGINSNKIEVIKASSSKKFQFKSQIKEKIILTVSSIDPRKNLKGVIEAYNMLDTDYKLMIVGSQNKVFSSGDINFEEILNPHIEFTGYVDDNKLVELYNRAEIFVYASFFEGFGIPPLEAQACGCVCVVSNLTSLPEVYKDSVEYCDPYSINSIKNKLDEIIHNSDKKRILRKKGFENIKQYSWDKSTLQLLNLINRIK